MSRPVPAQILALLAFLLGSVALLAPGSAGAAEESQIPGRLAALSGEVLVRGDQDDGWSYGEANISVFEGDVLRTEAEATAIIELPDVLTVRMAPLTEVKVVRTARPARLDLPRGALFVCVGGDRRKAATLLTAGAEITADGGSAFRVDVDDKGSTRVSVRRGFLTVSAMKETAILRDGLRVFVDPGLLPSAPVRFDPSVEEDDFDTFNRDACLEPVEEPDDIPRERETRVVETIYIDNYVQTSHAVVGWNTLDGYGSWVWVGGHRCWRPFVTIGWRPYGWGHWGWSWRWGWTWVPYEPWGYVTHHYGAWDWIAGYGWCWYPSAIWSPANVHWWRHGGYLYWTPYNRWGRPCSAGGPWHTWGHGLRVDLGVAGVARFDGRQGMLHPLAEPAERIARGGGEVLPVPNPRETLRPPDARRTGRLVDSGGTPADRRAEMLGDRLGSGRGISLRPDPAAPASPARPTDSFGGGGQPFHSTPIAGLRDRGARERGGGGWTPSRDIRTGSPAGAERDRDVGAPWSSAGTPSAARGDRAGREPARDPFRPAPVPATEPPAQPRTLAPPSSSSGTTRSQGTGRSRGGFIAAPIPGKTDGESGPSAEPGPTVIPPASSRTPDSGRGRTGFVAAPIPGKAVVESRSRTEEGPAQTGARDRVIPSSLLPSSTRTEPRRPVPAPIASPSSSLRGSVSRGEAAERVAPPPAVAPARPAPPPPAAVPTTSPPRPTRFVAPAAPQPGPSVEPTPPASPRSRGR